jgi:hypothetical protein
VEAVFPQQEFNGYTAMNRYLESFSGISSKPDVSVSLIKWYHIITPDVSVFELGDVISSHQMSRFLELGSDIFPTSV